MPPTVKDTAIAGEQIYTLPETNSSSLNWMIGIRSFPFGARPIFRCELLVSPRVYSIECIFASTKIILNETIQLVDSAVDLFWSNSTWENKLLLISNNFTLNKAATVALKRMVRYVFQVVCFGAIIAKDIIKIAKETC